MYLEPKWLRCMTTVLKLIESRKTTDGACALALPQMSVWSAGTSANQRKMHQRTQGSARGAPSEAARTAWCPGTVRENPGAGSVRRSPTGAECTGCIRARAAPQLPSELFLFLQRIQHAVSGSQHWSYANIREHARTREHSRTFANVSEHERTCCPSTIYAL